MKPGATTSPRASKLSSALPRVLFGRATSATRPSRRRTSMGALSFAAGSIRWPPLISRLWFSFRWLTPDLTLPYSSLKAIRFDETNHPMAELHRMLHIHKMSGVRNDYPFRFLNAGFNGSSMRVYVRYVRVANQNQSRNANFVQTTNRRQSRTGKIAVRHILRIGG